MEYYESINGFKIGKADINSVITQPEVESTIVEGESVENDMEVYLANCIWVINMFTSFLVWAVCIVALILNITKKNVGKAIFAGIGLIMPIITTILISAGRMVIQVEEKLSAGIIIVVIGAIIQAAFIIVPFIFWFSKDKRKINNDNQANQ